MSEKTQAADGLELWIHDWPVDGPRLAVAIVHGYGEHGGRYAHVAQAFNRKGMAVYAADLRGHGQSAGPRGYVSSFSDYHRDVDALVELVKRKHAGVPLAIFAHSMGGLILFHWLIAGRGRELVGVAVSSPLLGVSVPVPAPKLFAAKIMSAVLPKVSLASGLSGELVTHDPEMARLYDSDPLNLKIANSRWFTEMVAAAERVQASAGQIDRPLLLLYAGDDKLVSADATDQLSQKLTMKDKTSERLPGRYHELVNEPLEVREPLIARYGDWLLAHADKGQA